MSLSIEIVKRSTMNILDEVGGCSDFIPRIAFVVCTPENALSYNNPFTPVSVGESLV